MKRLALAIALASVPLAACQTARPDWQRVALTVVEGARLTRDVCNKFLALWPAGTTAFHDACAIIVTIPMDAPAEPSAAIAEKRG